MALKLETLFEEALPQKERALAQAIRLKIASGASARRYRAILEPVAASVKSMEREIRQLQTEADKLTSPILKEVVAQAVNAKFSGLEQLKQNIQTDEKILQDHLRSQKVAANLIGPLLAEIKALREAISNSRPAKSDSPNARAKAIVEQAELVLDTTWAKDAKATGSGGFAYSSGRGIAEEKMFKLSDQLKDLRRTAVTKRKPMDHVLFATRRLEQIRGALAIDPYLDI